MEIKILVKENEKAELDKFIKTCKEHGMELTREGGGKLPNFSGYYAEFKGVRWQKADTGERQYNIPDVSGSASFDAVKQIWNAAENYTLHELGEICKGDSAYCEDVPDLETYFERHYR